MTYKNLESVKRLANIQNQTIEAQKHAIQTQAETIHSQTQVINNLYDTVKKQQSQINELNSKVTSLETQVKTLSIQLGKTTSELQETQRLLNIAKKYEERVNEGIDLSQAYKLLGDYDKTVDIVRNITSIGTPANDQELWNRVRDIYNWLGNNYHYCSDKGFCVGDWCTQIQFFSPDELLYYGSQDVLCGDCDDQAQLFVGMLYASGVPHDKARVECGVVPGGAHCWGGVYVNGSWYRVDPVCSNPAQYWEFFGYKFLISGKEFPVSYQNIDCFSSYTLSEWYTPEGYHTV
jgi:cell division protein FtsB